MHSAALATADSLLANWLPQAPAASRLALESAGRLYTVQAISTTLVLAVITILCIAISNHLFKRAAAIGKKDRYDRDADPYMICGIIVMVLALFFTGVTLATVPETAAFLFAGKAATALRLMGKF